MLTRYRTGRLVATIFIKLGWATLIATTLLILLAVLYFSLSRPSKAWCRPPCPACLRWPGSPWRWFFPDMLHWRSSTSPTDYPSPGWSDKKSRGTAAAFVFFPENQALRASSAPRNP